MNLHQRGLVDACFEEGQYDEGIALLSQLRSQNVMPSVPHIRQLLYLSLYPSMMNKQPIDPNLSPAKIGKQQRPVTISQKTAVSARSLLLHFAITNHPDGVARALPSYCPHEDNENDDSESFIARESHNISMGKNCWNMLQKGFIRRAIITSPSKRGARRMTAYEEEEEDGDGDFATSDVVAEHAWPILNFLLILFERDERETEARGLPRHSVLLLNQIPAPRSGKGARWEADAPLSVILSAITQRDEQRQMMGARLTELLINLSATTLFDFTMFLNLVFNRVYISAPKEFLMLLASLPSTIPILKFRIALLHKFIRSSDKNIAEDVSLRPKARARPIRRARDEAKPIEELSTSQSISILNQITLPSYIDICRSIEGLNPKSNDGISYPWIHSQLLVSFGIYQSLLPAETRDEEWQKFLASDDFQRQLNRLLPGSWDQDAEVLGNILNISLPTWKY
ncbi:hypothetical protein GYMLUDRAFT_156189 [Collybiopsis luxurians FD-317 M1]|nr:hypothetical protein GYMLUDRAFT_156189 [Collybiopsis luxurians FD-317 M1]